MLWSAELCNEISADNLEVQPTRNIHSDGDKSRCKALGILPFEECLFLLKIPREITALPLYSGTHPKSFTSVPINYWAQFSHVQVYWVTLATLCDPGVTGKPFVSISAPFSDINLGVSSPQFSFMIGHLARRILLKDHNWDLHR